MVELAGDAIFWEWFVVTTLYDLPESRQRNFLWVLASRFRAATDLGFDPRATTFGSALTVSLVDDQWITVEKPDERRVVTPESTLWSHLGSEDPARPFGPTMGDLLDGSALPEPRSCGLLAEQRWESRFSARAAFALQGRPSNEFAEAESARMDGWRALTEKLEEGEVPWNSRSVQPRCETDWHWADADGHLLCCNDIEPIEGAVDLLSVPEADRCPKSTKDWPPSLISWHFQPRSQQVLAVRRVLVDETGPRCAICRVNWATVIDHDHLTGMARGYVCTGCNGIVDRCTHLDGCAYAEYLNDPPAVGLALQHPNHKASQRRRGDLHVRRVEYFDRLVAEVADRG